MKIITKQWVTIKKVDKQFMHFANELYTVEKFGIIIKKIGITFEGYPKLQLVIV